MEIRNIMNNAKHPNFSQASTEKERRAVQMNPESEEMLAKLQRMPEIEIVRFLKENAESIPLRDENHELYRFKNLFFHRTSGFASENIENIATGNNSDAVPAFVDYIKLDNNDFLTITRSKYFDLIPFRECTAKVDTQAKQNFYKEIKDEINLASINPELFANNNIWFVSSDLKHFVIADWSHVSLVFDPDDKKAAIQKLKELLNL